MTLLGAPAIPDARNWLDRTARAAAVEVGQTEDAMTISQALLQT